MVRRGIVVQAACVAIVVACVGEDAGTTVDLAVDGGPADAGGSIDGSDAAVAVDSGCGDTRTSHDNCGTCGTVCGSAEACFDGVCDGDKLVDISAGDGSACAVTKSGAIYCWGRNELHQLAADTGATKCNGVACSPTAVRAVGIDDATQVSVGDDWTCAVRRSGAVACWGLNDRGQLGHEGGDDTCNGAKCNETPRDVVGLPGGDPVVQVVAGGQPENAHTCARTKAGAVLCWGDNSRGQLGNTTLTPASSSSPIPVVGIASGATFLTAVGRAGVPAACVITSTKTLSCWGGGNEWNVGRDPATANGTCTCYPTAAPPTITGADDIASVAMSDASMIVLKSNGASLTWGFVGYAVHNGNNGVAAPVKNLPAASSVVASFNFACARTSTGAVWCWGGNDEAQLGQGDLGSNATCNSGPCWTEAKVVPGITAARIAVGNRAGFAIQDHAAWGWGRNTDGRLGHDPSSDTLCNGERCSMTPQKIQGLPGTK